MKKIIFLILFILIGANNVYALADPIDIADRVSVIALGSRLWVNSPEYSPKQVIALLDVIWDWKYTKEWLSEFYKSKWLSAEDAAKKASEDVDASKSWWPITVITTELIPGAACTCTDAVNQCKKVETRKYECTVQKGMTAFQQIIGKIIKWFIYIIMLLGVLAIVGAGIMMAFWSDSEEYTKKAKWWAMNIIIGLVILFTFSYILKLLAPWVYQ